MSEGIDGDYSAFKIRCLTCRQEAMAYRAHVRIDTYYKILDEWGRKYNNALIGVERNNHGHAVLLGLDEYCHYPNLYCENQPQTRIITSSSKKRPEKKLGWHTTPTTKALMLNRLKISIEGEPEEDENTFQPEYTVYDLTFLSECLTFQRNGFKLESVAGKHDDAVIASAICNEMVLYQRQRLNRGGINKVLLGAKREIEI